MTKQTFFKRILEAKERNKRKDIASRSFGLIKWEAVASLCDALEAEAIERRAREEWMAAV